MTRHWPPTSPYDPGGVKALCRMWFILTARPGLRASNDNGEGVPEDAAEAARWFRLAAEQGDARAQYNLGDMYANGKGVPQDNVEAHMWLNLAASRSSGADRERRVATRDRVAERMTPADLTRLPLFGTSEALTY